MASSRLILYRMGESGHTANLNFLAGFLLGLGMMALLSVGSCWWLDF